MSDLMASKYSDSGNQRAAPQVPVTNSCREVNYRIRLKFELKLIDKILKSKFCSRVQYEISKIQKKLEKTDKNFHNF